METSHQYAMYPCDRDPAISIDPFFPEGLQECSRGLHYLSNILNYPYLSKYNGVLKTQLLCPNGTKIFH